MAPEVAGRDDELAAVRTFVGGDGSGFAALVLAGEAGIGKSTLWLAGVEAARAQGLRVLASRPAEAEHGLAFAGLGDLFEGVLDEVLPALTAPRRRALEVALLLAEEPEEAADPRALGVAVRSALQLVSRDVPVLLAIDDVQWLDPTSSRILAFVCRRLAEEDVRLLLARRSGHDPTPLEVALDPDRARHMHVGPLSRGALHVLLRHRLGRTFSRPMLVRLHDVSGGNPFYALELARPLGAAADAVVVPETLGRLVQARLAALPDATHEALLLAAAHGHASSALVAAAGIDRDALAPALAANVVEEDTGAIRFTHPLLASTLYQGVSDDDRNRAHATLSQIVGEPVERARHLALSAKTPAAETAQALEDAAGVALARGAAVAAAELHEHAARLTPADDTEGFHRRTLAATATFLAAGDTLRAEALVRPLVATAAPGADRAEALRTLATVRLDAGDIEESIALFREALVAATADPAAQCRLHQHLARSVRFTEGLGSAEQHARAAVDLAEQAGDVSLRAGALGALALLRFNAGEADALALAEEAERLAGDVDDAVLRTDVRFELAHILVWSYRLDRARPLLEALHADWRDRDENLSLNAVWYLALVEFRAGRWARAAEHAGTAREIGLQNTTEQHETPSQIWPVALLALHRGDVDRARELAELGLERAEGRPALRAHFHATLGLAASWSDDPETAAARFADAETDAADAEIRHPGMLSWRDEYVEALLRLDRREEAVTLLDAWEGEALRLGADWTLARAKRCRGLAATSMGDQERAAELLEEAVAQHETAGDPFGRARTLLVLGAVRRRLRQKRTAREAIAGALAAFEELGAGGWAEKARGELGRIGGRRRETGLTPAERRVAELVARGSTNREVAAALFLAERTVEAHLSHVYAKLGVRSRTELTRVLQ
jgi:DNA-binding CsgD family transcriptional regulator